MSILPAGSENGSSRFRRGPRKGSEDAEGRGDPHPGSTARAPPPGRRAAAGAGAPGLAFARRRDGDRPPEEAEAAPQGRDAADFHPHGTQLKLSDEEIERLRRSGIRLDAEGRFWHEGAEVTHGGLRAALWRWLDRNPDGRWVLRLDANRFVYLDVDDAPHFVRSLRWEGERAILLLADGSEETLDYASLRLAKGTAYGTVRGRFAARFSTAAWAALGEHLSERDG